MRLLLQSVINFLLYFASLRLDLAADFAGLAFRLGLVIANGFTNILLDLARSFIHLPFTVSSTPCVPRSLPCASVFVVVSSVAILLLLLERNYYIVKTRDTFRPLPLAKE